MKAPDGLTNAAAIYWPAHTSLSQRFGWRLTTGGWGEQVFSAVGPGHCCEARPSTAGRIALGPRTVVPLRKLCRIAALRPRASRWAYQTRLDRAPDPPLGVTFCRNGGNFDGRMRTTQLIGTTVPNARRVIGDGELRTRGSPNEIFGKDYLK